MTAEERQTLRSAISERMHEYRQALIAGGWIEVCVECQSELDSVTEGCKTCHDRQRRRHRRATDPEYRAKQNEMDKARRRRQRWNVGNGRAQSRPAAS